MKINLDLNAVVLTCFFASFIIVLLKKFGAIEWLQIHGNTFISKLANCNFCISFWVSSFISIILLILTKDFNYLFMPFLTTTLTNKLL